jgi:hypothetical protein
MPFLNYSTQVHVETTLAAIHKQLVAHQAVAILYEYDATRQIDAVSFKIRLGDRELPYRLPPDWRAVLSLLRDDRRVPRRFKTEEQARRVAWRVVRDWIEAQLAFVDMRQVSLDQVMLPYLQLATGESLYQRLRTYGYALPPATADASEPGRSTTSTSR